MSNLQTKTLLGSFKHYIKSHLTWVILIITILYPGQPPKYLISLKSHNDNLIQSNISYAPYPVNDGTEPPSLTANAVFVQDADLHSVLYARNEYTKMLPASTTKMMTALVALDIYPDLNELLIVSVEDHTLGQTMDLVKGEKISVYNLLAGLLIRSGNDAALTLANNAPGGGYDTFVQAMNEKAANLGLTGTKYKNPSGLEQYDHVTTARDLAVLISEVVKHDILTNLMLQKSLVVTDDSGQIVHELTTTDELLGIIPGIRAAKTGFTQNAGECLVTYVEQNGRKIITVVLRSKDRFGETKKLLDWAYNHHTWITPPDLLI